MTALLLPHRSSPKWFRGLPNNAVAGRTGANAAARVIDFDAMGKRDIQNAAGQTRVPVGNFVGIDFDRHIHRKKRDREFLRRRWRRLFVDVWISTAHFDYGISYLPASRSGWSKTVFPQPPIGHLTKKTPYHGQLVRVCSPCRAQGEAVVPNVTL